MQSDETAGPNLPSFAPSSLPTQLDAGEVASGTHTVLFGDRRQQPAQVDGHMDKLTNLSDRKSSHRLSPEGCLTFYWTG